MKRSIKIVSIVMAIAMIVTAMLIPASATADGGNVDITYSVEKYVGQDTNGVDANDIYAVTVYLNNDHPINSLLFPIYYESDIFTPVDGTDMSILDWGYTVDFAGSLVYTAYTVPTGSDLADTNKYNKVTSAAADRVVNARGAISGLGKSTVKAALPHMDYRDPATETAWWGSLSTTQYGAITLQYAGQGNYCNLQAYGKATPLITLLFKLNAGKTDADAVGAKFGYIEGGKALGGSVETSVDKWYYDGTSTATSATWTGSYCTVAGAVTPSYSVAKFKSEAFFTGNKTAAPDDLFNYRLTSVITNADLTAMNTGSNKITKVGFIAANTGAADAAAAQAAVEAGTTLPTAWKSASTDYISCTDTATADAYFGAIIKNISHAAQATDIDCYAYVCYNDGTADHYVWYTAAAKAAVSTGYDAAVTYWQTH